jgi:hypothetical protein
MKKLLIGLLVLLAMMTPVQAQASNKEVRLYLFHSNECWHCKSEIEWLDSIMGQYPNLVVTKWEVTDDQVNNELMIKVKQRFDLTTPNVPFTVIGDKYLIGFGEEVKTNILQLLDKYSNETVIDVVDEVSRGIDGPKITDGDIIDQNDTKFVIPILGEIDAKNVSLPLIAALIGIVDGFNPCAMWVLIFLISMLMGMHNKRRMWTLGVAFLFTSAMFYLLVMLAWLNVAVSLTQIGWIRIGIAIVALVGGYINLNAFLKAVKRQDEGCEVVDETKRQKLMRKIKQFTAEKSFWLALFGVIGLAISVNLVEFACSAGLPLLFTSILAMNSMPYWQYLLYCVIYILFFLLDDLIVFFVAMISLELTGISTKYTKYSHLIGGLIMLLLGLLMIFKPEWLLFKFF